MTDDVAALVPISDVAPQLGISKRTVDNLVTSGRLVRVRLSGRTFITGDSITTYKVMVRWLAGHVLPEVPRP